MTATENPGAYSLVAYAHDRNGAPVGYRIRRDDLDGTTAGVITRAEDGAWIISQQYSNGSWRRLDGTYATPASALAAFAATAAFGT
jgi:hypothetical protein